MQQQGTELTRDELIGQVIAVGFPGTSVNQEITDLIQHHHVGNIILFSRNIHDTQQLHTLTQQLQDIARQAGQRYPLLIMLDQENGMVRRLGQNATIFPGNMALGAIDSEETAYQVALATGRELKVLGINMNLAPVLDVNNNPANPVIGVRSFGEDPQLVARLGAAAVRGYQDAGIITSVKHFPGHGDTATDSHLALPVIPHNMERLEQIELVPFRSAIKAGATSVMVAHIYLPQLMPGSSQPATTSYEIIQGLLRTHLGYDGMVISDCLEMDAVARTISTEQGALQTLRAGADMALISHRYERQLGAIAAIKAALQDGSLSQARLTQASERVLALKRRFLSWEQPSSDEHVIGCAAHQQLSEQAYDSAITLVRDQANLIPLRLTAGQRLLAVLLQPSSHTRAIDQQQPQEALAASLRQHHDTVETMTLASSTPDVHERLRAAMKDAAITLLVTVNANLDPWQGELVQQALATQQPVIGVASYNPYDLLAYPQLATYLATYENTPPAFAALARVLFGAIQARGRLPVSLSF
ncbi:MAG TPA: beta-N-acetylhexosaminidase [Ktedonobacteraceae bacterium]